MEIAEAIHLIKPGIGNTESQIWADLGCGSGTFTNALARSLKGNSQVYAIDKNHQYFPRDKNTTNASIEFIQADFDRENISLNGLNGILMANSLHYVKEKDAFIRRLETHFATEKRFIIFEYDFMQPHPMVPYPVDYRHLIDLFSGLGYKSISKIGQRPSFFDVGNMYAALILKEN